MGGLQPMHWVIIIAVFVLLFGARKLPDAARALGKSLRIFKSEIKELQNDGKPTESSAPYEAPGASQPAERIVAPTPVESSRIDSTPGSQPSA